MIVHFTPLGIRVEARQGETLLDAARRVSAPVGSACGGVGICARCRVRVVAGSDALTSATTVERRTSNERGLQDNERLACLAVVRGDCAITTTYWGEVTE